MPVGPGVYDSLATIARDGANAEAVVLIVIGGNNGNGFSVQSTSLEILNELPKLLRHCANEIESSSGSGDSTSLQA